MPEPTPPPNLSAPEDPRLALLRRMNRQPWAEATAPPLIDPARVSPRRFLASLGRSLAGQVATLPAAGFMRDWLERVSEPPPGVAESRLAQSFAKMISPTPAEAAEFAASPLGALSFLPPLAPVLRVPDGIGIGLMAAYGRNATVQTALRPLDIVAPQASLRLRGVSPVKGAALPEEIQALVRRAEEIAQETRARAEIAQETRFRAEPPPDVVLSGDFYNWRPDTDGLFPPPPEGLGQKVAEAYGRANGDPTLSIYLARLLVDTPEVLAGQMHEPLVNRLLRLVSREHLNIGRDPQLVTAAIQRQATARLVFGEQVRAMQPLDQRLATLAGYDRRSGNFTRDVQLRQGYDAAPSVVNNYNDVVTRPYAYDMPESLRLWLSDRERYQRDLFQFPEHQNGIAYEPVEHYAPAFYRARKGPEGDDARRILEELRPFSGDVPRQRLGAKQAFEYRKIFANPQVAWEHGFEIRPDARTFAGATVLRSRASSRALSDAVGERVAKELGGDSVVQSLRTLLGESANPVLRRLEQIVRASVAPVLNADLAGVMAAQLPRALLSEVMPRRVLSDLSSGRVPLPTWRALGGVLPSFMSRYPLHGLALLKVLIPRMYRTEATLEFMRRHADTLAEMRGLGFDPFPNVSGYASEFWQGAGGKLGEILSAPSRGQFQGVLAKAKVLSYENQRTLLRSVRELLTEDERLAFLTDGPVPVELAAKLKSSPSAFADNTALLSHLANVYGGIDATRIAARPLTRTLEQGFLAPGWMRAKLGTLFSAAKLDKQGELARWFLIDALTSYVLTGEAVSYAQTGEGMNLTRPDKGDFLAIRIGPGKSINPMTPLTGPVRAAVSPIYRRIKEGKWDFRTPGLWAFGQLNPLAQMAVEMPRDQKLYGGRAITTLAENSLRSRFFYALRAEAPVAVQQFLDMQQTGTFGSSEAGLTAFSFNINAPSSQTLLIRDARLQAALAAGLPEAQAHELARYGDNPINAKDEAGKYILGDQARASASAAAFRYAHILDPSITQDAYDQSGFRTTQNRAQQDAKIRGFADRDQKAGERHWARVNEIGQQYEDTLRGKLKGDDALSGDKFRETLAAEMASARKERWGIDAERNQYVDENNLRAYWQQTQRDGLDAKTREDVARQAFLFGGQDTNGDQHPGILSLALYDPATGLARYKDRDALLAKWQLLVGEDTVAGWLRSWRTADLNPIVREYWDGLDKYEYYFETRDRVLAKASPLVRRWFAARDAALNTRDRLRQNMVREAWPAEAKAAEDRMEMEREYLRRTVPGLDPWLLKFGYRNKPVEEE